MAIQEIRRLRGRRTVLDPMSGSGTVIREAIGAGHRAIGFDVDPLAVLMARVWTRSLRVEASTAAVEEVVRAATRHRGASLPWLDDDPETAAFVNYWFAPKQQDALRGLAWALAREPEGSRSHRGRVADLLRLSLSRTIVTKDSGASLARDVSHSRPHRVTNTSAYDVITGFRKNVAIISRILVDDPPKSGARVALGDARKIKLLDRSVDLVLTSPPYLNAIDYLRGHRMALVWLGHRLSELRSIRAGAIGTEKVGELGVSSDEVRCVKDAMIADRRMSPRHSGMVERYSSDLVRLMGEIGRVLRINGRAVLVVGNSCLRGVFIESSAGVIQAAGYRGLELSDQSVRNLPEASRYLPMGKDNRAPLGKRMRTESVLTFRRAA